MYRFSDDVGLRPLLRGAAFRRLLLGLLAVDLVFIGLHVAHVWSEWQAATGGLVADRGFSLEQEGGAGEAWEAVKTVLCVAGLMLVARRTAQPVYAAVAFGFTLALLDNVFELHESGGAWLAEGLQAAAWAFEAAPQALGELAVFALEGLLIGAALLIGFRRSARGHWPAAAVAVAMLGLLAALGVGLDLLHAALGGLRRAMDRGLGFIEDGGELLTLSFAAAFALALSRRLAAPREQPAGSRSLAGQPGGGGAPAAASPPSAPSP